jgi:hypothetical protein
MKVAVFWDVTACGVVEVYQMTTLPGYTMQRHGRQSLFITLHSVISELVIKEW